jgi:hypothetical protein
MHLKWRCIIPLSTLSLSGCEAPAYGGDGATVVLLIESGYQVTYSYDSRYTSELAFVIQAAELHCRQYNRHDRLTQNIRNGIDRSTAILVCDP